MKTPRLALLTLVVLLILALWRDAAHANAGVFAGEGHSIELSSTDAIRMASEEVTIIPGRGPFHFDGTVPGMNRVAFDCLFVLENLKDEAVEITVGFPLNAGHLDYQEDRVKTSDLIARYSFIAQEEGHVYSPRYVPGDRKKKLRNLFLWEMKFQPGETKALRVTYQMPISMALGSTTDQPTFAQPGKDWRHSLEIALVEFFGYVTETGNSWSGSIGKATFKVYTRGFEKYLLNRPFNEGITHEQQTKLEQRYPIMRPVSFRTVIPQGWQEDETGFLVLNYEDYRPEENLMFRYYVVGMPQNLDDLARQLQHLKKSGFTDADRKELADIYREFNGERTGNGTIQAFVEKQKWFGQKPLQPIPQEVIEALEEQPGGNAAILPEKGCFH